jgi:membrane protein
VQSRSLTRMPIRGWPIRGWKEIAVGVGRSIGEDRVLALAAGATFYAMLALSPALAAGVSLYSLFADARRIAEALAALAGVLPSGALDVIRDQLTRLAAKPTSALGVTFLVSLGVSLWSANAGTKAVLDALNVVYGIREKRGFVKLNLVSLTFTFGTILFALLAFAATIVLPVALDFLGLQAVTQALLQLARWPLLFAAVCLALGVLYHWGPSRAHGKWRWATVGSIIAATLWLVVSVLFSWYAANFAKYNETYGSLGAIVASMMWVWLSTVAVLLGGEVDEQIEKQTDEGGRP